MNLLPTFLLIMYSFNLSAYENAPQGRPSLYGSLKDVACPINIIPSKSIGPIELGRDIKEIEALGMPIKTVQGPSTLLIVGKYSIALDPQNKVHLIEMEIGDLPDCLFFAKKKISHKSSAKSLSKLFKNCKKEQQFLGGNIISCEGISIGTGGWGGRQKTPSLKINTPA